MSSRVLNALTVDVEDYFHVSAFDSPAKRLAWSGFESRVSRNTERLLASFEELGVHATFFVLGWVAERFPALVQRIVASGHEVASHGYAHQLVYDLSREAFQADVQRAKTVIEQAGGRQVIGYRAPSFSITTATPWAVDVLVETGHRYDSSVFPVRRARYGNPRAPRSVHRLGCASGSLLELPPSTVRLGRLNVPVAGGGYLRLYPYGWTRQAVRWLNHVERRPAVVYLHPWEIDPGQPRQRGTLANRFRHYVNLHRTEARLRTLLHDFAFGPAEAVLAAQVSTRDAPHGVLGGMRAGVRKVPA